MKFQFLGAAAVFVLSCQTLFAHSLSAPNQVDVDVVKGDPIPAATFAVTSSPTDLPFEITSSSSFFTISVSRNTTPATVTIQFDQSVSAQLGELTGSISITMPELQPEYDLQATVEVRLLVRELGAPPLIRTSRRSFLFTATTLSPVNDTRTLRISNGGGESLTYAMEIVYSAGQPSGWLDVFPTGGTITDKAISHTFNFLTSSLPPGSYTAQLKITGNTTNSPQFVSVALVVTEPPLLAPNPFQLNLQAVAGRKSEGVASFEIQNLGGGSATYLMTLGVPWLKIVPLQATVSDDPVRHVVAIDAIGMPPGEYSTLVPIQALTPGVPNDSVTVNLTLTEPPVLGVSPSNVSLGGVTGSESVVEGAVVVTSELASSLNWTAVLQQATPWLEVTPAGPAPGVLRLRADASALVPGVYTAEISLSAQIGGGTSYADTLRVPVTFAVTPAASSRLLLTQQTALLESHADGSPSSQTFGIRSTWGAGQSWSVEASSLAPWLSINANQSETPAVVELSANPSGLTAGLYSKTVAVVSGDERKGMNVVFAVGDNADDSLRVAPRGLTFMLQARSTRAASGRLWAINRDEDAVSWNIVFGNGSQPDWLSLPALSGAVAADESMPIEVRANATGLEAGEYSSVFRVDTPDGASRFVTVLLRVEATDADPQPAVNPAGLVLQSQAGASEVIESQIHLTEISGLSAQFQAAATSSNSWLSLSENQGVVTSDDASSLTARADPTGLAPGAHRGEIVVGFVGGQTAVVPVLFIVRPTAALIGPAQSLPCSEEVLFANLSSPTPGFHAQTGVPFPLELEIKNACGEGVDGMSTSIEFSSLEPSIALEGYGDGRYVGTWTPQVTAQQVTAAVMLQGAQTVSTTGEVADGGRVWIGRGGVVNGADFIQRQTVTSGSIVSLFGDLLASAPAYAPEVPLPATLSQASVLVDGAVAPLFAVFPQQINFQVPYETASKRIVDVVVRAGNRLSAPERLAVVDSQPGIFELPIDFDGSDRAAAINQDGTLNSTVNPAESRSVVTVFLTGQGPLSTAVPTGAASPVAPALARAVLESGATVNGQPAQLEFLGLAPGFVGLLQANVRLGEVAASDAQAELAIRIGEHESIPRLISIKP